MVHRCVQYQCGSIEERDELLLFLKSLGYRVYPCVLPEELFVRVWNGKNVYTWAERQNQKDEIAFLTPQEGIHPKIYEWVNQGPGV